MTPELTAALEDVRRQRERDDLAPVSREAYPAGPVLHSRMAATIQAWKHRDDEPYAVRQALVDLAAISTELAARLPRPDVGRS